MATAMTTCPACGARIHAVAGRCKQCKADLVSHRARAALQQPAPSAPPPGNATPSRRWWIRWPTLVGAAALIVIGVSVGMLVEQSRTTAPRQSPTRRSTTSPSPRPTPDNMPMPTVPTPAPVTPAPSQPPTTGHAPQPNKEPVETFAGNLSKTLCDKFRQCGLAATVTENICMMLESAIALEFPADRVRTGQCTFAEQSAQRCLRAIRDLDCDPKTASGDIMEWLLTASSLAECSDAYVCR